MPGPIVHLIVQQRLARALHAEPEGKELAKLLDSGGCDPFAAFGSMGPDYLFFSLKEYGTPLDELTHFLFGVYDAFRPLVDFYEKNIEPIVKDVEDAIDSVDDALFAGIFQSGTLPQKLADLIVTAMDEVYVTPPAANPAPMTAGDLDDTYRLWLEWFRRATTVLDARKPTPVPPPGTAAITLVTDFVGGFPPFPGASGPPSGGFNPAAILAALAAFAQWVADSVSYTTNWAANHAHDIVTLPVTAAHELTKWLLYQVQKGLWEMYDNVRFALVLGGYIFPEQRDLAKAPWGMALTRSGPVHPRWHLYPRKQEAHGLTGPMEHHLIYPNEPSELPHAEPMPQPFHTQPPEAFITDSWPYDPAIEMLWQCTDPYGPTDAFTHTVDSMTWNTAQFGSGLSFSARLIAQRMNNMPNFNLDGDRGYGWKTWRAVKPDIENQGGPTQPPLDVADYGIA